MLIGLFVDDIISIYSPNDTTEWLKLKSSMMSTYSMKDLGSAQWILGMQIRRDRPQRLLQLSMESYVDKMVHDYEMKDAGTLPTPEESSVILSKADEAKTQEEIDAMGNRPYMQIVGSLLYSTLSVFFECSHAVGVLTRFMQNPGPKHWYAAKRVLRYLK